MIKPKPIAKLSNKGVPAFTILESLVTLGITCFMVMSLSGSLNGIFQSVEETLFFLSFENLYRDTQTLANVNQRAMTLTISEDAISNGVSKVSLPRQVKSSQFRHDHYLLHYNSGRGSFLRSLHNNLFFCPDKKLKI